MTTDQDIEDAVVVTATEEEFSPEGQAAWMWSSPFYSDGRDPRPGKIYGLLAQALQIMKGVEKAGRNKQQNFSFRSIDDIAVASKAVFEEVGIFVAPSMKLLSATPDSGKGQRVMIQATYTFYADDGSSVNATTIGEGADSYDKATNKAMAAAFKYALMQTLCIGDPSDDGDAHGAPAEEAPRQQAQEAPAQTRAPQVPADDWKLWEKERTALLDDEATKNELAAWLQQTGIKVDRGMSIPDFAALRAKASTLLERGPS